MCVGGMGGGGGLTLRNMLWWPWVTLAETPALSRPAASRCHMGGVGGGGRRGGGGGIKGGGIRHVARLSEGGHLTREAACCELHRLVHCSTTVLNHGLCRKIPLLSLGWVGGGGDSALNSRIPDGGVGSPDVKGRVGSGGGGCSN